MITYSVHELPSSTDTLVERADRITFVKEGFAWWAFLIPVFWLIYQRMWLVLLGFVGVTVVLNLIFELFGLGEVAAAVASLGLGLLLALEANDLRRWTLRRRGFEELGLVTGKRRDECEFRFFTAWLADMEAPGHSVSNGPRADTSSSRSSDRNPTDEVVGVFPVANG
ncbi:MAG: DUF2628 domain-containing protein [Methyloligellaceae bacterium]